MSFKKNGEKEIYIEQVSNVKNASEKKTARYTVDDLVRDSSDQDVQLEKEKKNVSD